VGAGNSQRNKGREGKGLEWRDLFCLWLSTGQIEYFKAAGNVYGFYFLQCHGSLVLQDIRV